MRRTGHAGEAWRQPREHPDALEALGSERIDHGVAIVEDRVLVAPLAGERIPLTVCPNRNVVIANRFRRSPTTRSAGCARPACSCTINTDDPAMMEWDLGREYRAVGEAFGLALPDLHRLAVDGIASTWLDDSDRRTLTAEFEAALDADPILRQGLPVPSDPA